MKATDALTEEKMGSGTSRTVAGILNSIETLEGAGFLVRRPFPKASLSEFDPFLLLDEMGPMTVAPNQARVRPIIHTAALRQSLTCFQARWSTRIRRGTQEN